MNALDRLLSLVRPGDTINLAITGTDSGAQIVIAARLKGHEYDPDEDDSATSNLVRELTYPHLVRVAPDQSVSSALDAALDSLSGAQAEGLAALSELDRASSRIREAAAAASKPKVENKAPAKPSGKKVTVSTDAPPADGAAEDAEADEGANGGSAAPAAAAEPTAPAETPASSFFDPT